MFEVRGGHGPIVRNKANLGGTNPEARRLLGPQAPPLGTGVPNKANSSTAGKPAHPADGVGCTNKANSRVDRKGQGPVLPARPIVRNKPNLPQMGREDHARAFGLDHATHQEGRPPNKANCAEAAGRASTWWKKSYGELNIQETSARQSQFPPDGHGQRAGGRAGGGTYRAKRSQFASARPQEAPLGPVVQTKPIGPGPTGSGAGPGPQMRPPAGTNVQNEASFRPGPTRWFWNPPPEAGRPPRCPVSSGLCLTLAIWSFIKTGLFSVIDSL